MQSCFKPLSNERESMRFTCCLKMGFNLTYLKSALICLSDITQGSNSAGLVIMLTFFVFDIVMTFESLTLTPFCLEISSVRL